MTVLQDGARIGKCKLLWKINRPNESDLECIQKSVLNKCLASLEQREP